MSMQPDLHAHIDELPAPRRSRWSLRVAVIGLAALVVWAGVSQIDQVTRAQAQIIASARTQLVQSADAGVLSQLHVKEGDAVKAGQLLAVLERERAQAAVNDSKAKAAALKITLARLRAEVYGEPLQFEPALRQYDDYIRNQRSLYHKRKAAIEQDVASLRHMQALAMQELKMNQALEVSGDVSRAEILRLRRTVAELDAQIANKGNKYLQDAQAEMTKAQEDLNTQLELLHERSQLLEHTELVAPGDGIVKNIKVTTLGGVLRPGETLLEILPTGGDLVAEAKISPADIAFVREGQSASVKLDAYDYSIFGAMRGEVSYISADTLIEDTRVGPQAYYRVHIRIREAEFKGKAGNQIQIRPGMTASVDIKAMERSVLSYLTKPITKTLAQAFGER